MCKYENSTRKRQEDCLQYQTNIRSFKANVLSSHVYLISIFLTFDTFCSKGHAVHTCILN